MTDAIEPVEELTGPKRKRDPYEAYQAFLEIPSYAGSLLPVGHQSKIFNILFNPDHDLNEATLENRKIESKEQTKRAQEDERGLDKRILEDQLPPKNSLKRRVVKISEG